MTGGGFAQGGFAIVGQRRHAVPYAAYSLGSFALLTLAGLAVAVRRTKTPAASDRA